VAQLAITCADGASLRVTPQTLFRARLFPTDGSAESASSNASVLLRRPEGTLLLSKGSGEVVVLGRPDVEALGEQGALDAAEGLAGAYWALLDGDKICMRDAEGTEVEVGGDRTVRCKVPGTDPETCRTPRCRVPATAYGCPEVASLPQPEGIMQPRLLVVYGDGEAEELLSVSVARGLLRRAGGDPCAMVAPGEPMGSPMDRCKCHTIYRTVVADPAKVPMEPLELPPTVAGPSDFAASGAGTQRTYTEFRQLIEYPAIGRQERAAFLDARARFDAREAAHRAEHAAYGEGLRAHRPTKQAQEAKEVMPAEGGA